MVIARGAWDVLLEKHGESVLHYLLQTPDGIIARTHAKRLSLIEFEKAVGIARLQKRTGEVIQLESLELLG
jgi:hypothetical protein